jgi:SAM-dependent methyltransferase
MAHLPPYRGFAEVYDRVMRPVGYEMWADYVLELCEAYGRQPRQIIDLACGTGSTTLPFARRGCRVTGVDRSPDMLAVARLKAAEQGFDIAFVLGDMRAFEAPEPADLVTCLYDSINYLLGPDDLAEACRAVRRALKPDGLFIFDVNTRYRLSQVEDEVLVFQDDDYCLVWRNTYDASLERWRADLTGFVRRGEVFERFQERHEERPYDPADIEAALAAGGLELLGMFEAFGYEPVTKETNRIYVVAKRPEDQLGADSGAAKEGAFADGSRNSP